MSTDKLEISWNIDQESIYDFKENEQELKSQTTELNDYAFYLNCIHKDKSNLFLNLHLVSLPNVIGAVKFTAIIKSEQISYSKQFDNCILTLQHGDDEEDEKRYDGDTYDQYSSFVTDTISFNQLKDIKSLEFQCNIEILIKYDLFGGIFSSTNKAISIKPTEETNKVVYGYLHEIYDFDESCINLSPLSIYDMIYRYYLMILMIENENAVATFLWKFHNSLELDAFFDCKHGDVMTSSKFEINGCIFYFELTPNGWSTMIPENNCGVWIAVDSLPHNVHDIGIEYKVKCEEIEYEAIKEEYLSAPNVGSYSTAPDEDMNREEMVSLQKFQFEIFVRIFDIREKID